MKLFAWLAACAAIVFASPALAVAPIGFSSSDGLTAAPVSPKAPLPVGLAAIPTATFTTPAATSAYASGQQISNSATAGSVVPMTFTVCRDTTGTTGMIRRARINTSDTGFAGVTIRLHLYKSSPTSANGDHGTYSTTESGWVGDIDVILDHAFSDPLEEGEGVPSVGSEINYACNTAVQVLYGLLEARGAITPQGAKAATVTLEALPN